MKELTNISNNEQDNFILKTHRSIMANGSGLYVVGDLTHKSSIELQKFNKSTKV